MGHPAGMDAPTKGLDAGGGTIVEKRKQDQSMQYAEDYEPPDCCCFPSRPNTSKQPITEDVSCGWFGCKPRWLQKMADIRMFVIVMGAFYLVITVMEYYTIAMITTLEKRFGFSTSKASLLLTGNQIAFVVFVTFVSHFADKCHRPRVLAVSGFLVALAGLVYSLPYFLYPRKNINLVVVVDTVDLANKDLICQSLVSRQTNVTQCSDASEWDDDSSAFSILITGAVLTGLFGTPMLALSQTYIDDSVGPRRASLFLGFVNMMRPLGPVVAFVLGGIFTSQYEDLSDPGFDESDPRWIGAWWIGYILIPCMFIFPVLFLLMFPFRIPRDPEKDADYVPPVVQSDQALDEAKAAVANQGLCKLGISLKDFFSALWALLTNPIYMTLVIGGCVINMTVAGLFPFIPKYLEVMFHLPTSTANITTGLLSSLMAAFGVLIGGVISSRWKFSLRHMGIFILTMDVLFTVVLLLLIPIKCPDIHLVRRSDANSTCNTRCHCPPDQFHPVCGEDGKSYLSPCEAGCRLSHSNNTWSQCSCVQTGGSAVVSGVCDSGCQMWIPFAILLAIGAFVLFLASVPAITLQLRVVKQEHRSISFGFVGLLFSFIAFVPGPLVYGAIIDSTCQVWRESCGQKKECIIYNVGQFGIRAITATAAFSLLAILLHIAMNVFIKKLNRKEREWTSKETIMTHL